ncbi:MAG: surface lipoprotein assembly modifier [Roseibacillus sp.]
MAIGQGRTDQRMDNKLDRRAVRSQGAEKVSFKKGLDISLVSSLAYDNNIFQTPDNETSSLVAQLEPSVGWTAGSKDGTWVRLAYEAAAIVYFAQTEDSRIDHRVSVDGGVKGKTLSLAYSAGWAKVGSPSADIGGASDRHEWGGRAGVTYTPKGKVSYEFFADRAVVDQVEPAFFDFYQSSAGIAARYRHSRKTQVEAAYRFGQVEVDGSGKQTFHRLGLQALWSPRSKVSFSLEGGMEYRNYEVGSGVEPYLAARVDWTPRAKTALYLEAYRREEASAALEGENFQLMGIRAGVNQRLRDGWSVGLEVGRETTDYFGIAGLPESGREDTITYVRPSLRYSFGEDSELVVLYQWSKSDSTDSDFGYSNQQLGVSMNYRF